MDDRDGNETASGNYRSEGERRLAAFFENHAIRYAYEAPVLVKDHGKLKVWYPDFYLPELAVYVEYFGLAGLPSYDQGIAKKKMAYAESGLAVVSVYPWSLEDGLERYLISSLTAVLEERSRSLERVYRADQNEIGRYLGSGSVRGASGQGIVHGGPDRESYRARKWTSGYG